MTTFALWKPAIILQHNHNCQCKYHTKAKALNLNTATYARAQLPVIFSLWKSRRKYMTRELAERSLQGVAVTQVERAMTRCELRWCWCSWQLQSRSLSRVVGDRQRSVDRSALDVNRFDYWDSHNQPSIASLYHSIQISSWKLLMWHDRGSPVFTCAPRQSKRTRSRHLRDNNMTIYSKSMNGCDFCKV